MQVPLALDNHVASVGTRGRWLSDPADVVATDGQLVQQASALHLGFPRAWPAVFKQSHILRELVNAKLQGKRCRAIAVPPSGADAMIGAAHAAGLQPLHSFSNAERLTTALPEWQLVKGFAVFERLDAPAGAAFVAVRHWWVSSPAGTWLDFTPSLVPSCTTGKLLLVESARGEKSEAPLRGEGQVFAIALGERLAGHVAKYREAGDAATAVVPSKVAAAVEEAEKGPPVDVREEAAVVSVAVPVPPQTATSLGDGGGEPGVLAPSIATGIGNDRAVNVAEAEVAESEDEAQLETAHAYSSGEEKYATVTAVAGPAVGTSFDAKALKAQADDLFRNGHLQEAAKLYMLVTEPVVAAAVQAKEAGNLAFKRGDMKGAARIFTRWPAAHCTLGSLTAARGVVHVTGANTAYEEGLRHVGLQVGRFNYFSDQTAAEFGRILRRQLPPTLVFTLHSNRAAALLRLERYHVRSHSSSTPVDAHPTLTSHEPPEPFRRRAKTRARL